MRRREFITLLGGAAAAWPVGARAEQATVPVGGGNRFPAFTDGLAKGGYHDGRNVSIEFHSVSGSYDMLPAIAQELVSRGAAVIAPMGIAPRRQ